MKEISDIFYLLLIPEVGLGLLVLSIGAYIFKIKLKKPEGSVCDLTCLVVWPLSAMWLIIKVGIIELVII